MAQRRARCLREGCRPSDAWAGIAIMERVSSRHKKRGFTPFLYLAQKCGGMLFLPDIFKKRIVYRFLVFLLCGNLRVSDLASKVTYRLQRSMG